MHGSFSLPLLLIGRTDVRHVASLLQFFAHRLRVVRLENLERSKDALVSYYASLVPKGLDELSSKERNRIYKMMRLSIFADRDGSLTADWGCNVSSTPRYSYKSTTYTFRFRALLSGEVSEVELMVNQLECKNR